MISPSVAVSPPTVPDTGPDGDASGIPDIPDGPFDAVDYDAGSDSDSAKGDLLMCGRDRVLPEGVPKPLLF